MADKRLKTMGRHPGIWNDIIRRSGFGKPDVHEVVALAAATVLTDENGRIKTVDKEGNPAIIDFLLSSDVPTNNYAGTAAPTVNDDVTEGYSIGSLWIDTVANEAYRCVDATNGAAVWIESTLDAAESLAILEAHLYTVYNAGNVTGATTFDLDNGRTQKASMTGAVTIAVPSNGTEGRELILWLTPSGANRDLDFNGSILIPTDSGITLPKTLTQDKLYIVKLVRNATAWMLVSLVGGY